jgi:hypothetical protein
MRSGLSWRARSSAMLSDVWPQCVSASGSSRRRSTAATARCGRRAGCGGCRRRCAPGAVSGSGRAPSSCSAPSPAPRCCARAGRQSANAFGCAALHRRSVRRRRTADSKAGAGALARPVAEIVEHARWTWHGRITMGDAIRLTGASRNTLKQHFRSFVERGLLRQRGGGCGVWYERRRWCADAPYDTARTDGVATSRPTTVRA